MPTSARPREGGDPVLGKALDARFHGHERNQRPVRLCAPEVLVDRRPEGTIYLKSGRALPDHSCFGASVSSATGGDHASVGGAGSGSRVALGSGAK